MYDYLPRDLPVSAPSKWIETDHVQQQKTVTNATADVLVSAPLSKLNTLLHINTRQLEPSPADSGFVDITGNEVHSSARSHSQQSPISSSTPISLGRAQGVKQAVFIDLTQDDDDDDDPRTHLSTLTPSASRAQPTTPEPADHADLPSVQLQPAQAVHSVSSAPVDHDAFLKIQLEHYDDSWKSQGPDSVDVRALRLAGATLYLRFTPCSFSVSSLALADRAAHAEQVRHRAALVKATPRGNLSNSEEKALAAQLAKEKYLAKVAATCAEEVARAKRIAEEVKERKQAEEVKARLEMEERHAEAEKRRSEYQRNLQTRRARRANSADKKLAVVEEDDTTDPATQPKLDEHAASRRIQRAWRTSQNRAKVTAFVKLDLNAEQSAKRTFDEMTELIARSAVMSTTTKLLIHIGLEHTNDDNAALNTRTFLSAYMLIGHPSIVLNGKNGSQEQDVVTKANELVSAFEDCLVRLASWNDFKPSPMHLEALSQSYSAYTSAFAAWRLQDSTVLIEGMVASFVELDAIWQTVKDDAYGEVASDYREGIRDNQVKLLSRIQRLAGRDRADVLIKKAIRESRRRRPRRRAAAEVRPRGVEASTQAADRTVDTAVITDDESPHHSGELSRLFTAMPSNRISPHELAINKDYKLQEDKNKAELRDQVYRSICENMKLGFEAGQGALWTVSAAENVREKLLRMLKPGNSMYTLINETLDLEHINRQCQAGVFSYEGFFTFMANIMPKLCAPFRDQEVKVLTEELLGEATSDANASADELTIMTNKLFNLLRMVDKLSLDYSNFMIMNAAPTLIRESAGYEHRLFAKDIESGQISLERTQVFWRTAAATLNAEADRRDPDGLRRAEDRPTNHKIYAKALVDLAIAQGHLQNDEVPETLALDFARIKQIRAGTLRVAVIGAIFLTAKNLLKRDVRAQWKTEATRLWTLILADGYAKDSAAEDDAVTPEQKAFSILESAHNMPANTKAQVQSAVSRFFAQAAARRLTDPVLKVLYQRLRTHIFLRMNAVSSSERVRALSSASDALASCGLSEFTPQVGAMVDTLERIRQVDWASHSLWYEQIAGGDPSDI
ncbi:hypothetical protein AMS68_002451 [Peltaster fructicola]|uniref:Uncharacterized protein n=1 Tax=Peltaster fructicola TaxID=286661 RepID=A0A6H0XQC1_9PEZI|nr:hypothetical protein AMS68_002451 [Peltaster fructicola]